MKKQGKLELTWVGKYDDRIIEPRILIEDKSKSYGDATTQNMLIHGDNLIALKALEQDFAGKIKCIYIDPPFNTGSAFEHYEDGIEHSIWLSMMKARLELLKNLLSDDGGIFVHIDYNEEAYLRVLMDEIFGRSNFRNTIIVSRIKKNIREREFVRALNYAHDVIVFYAKSEKTVILPPTKKVTKNDRWHSFEANGVRNGMDYDLFGYKPKEGNHWRWSYDRAQQAIKDGTLRPNPRTGKPEYFIPASDTELMDTIWTDLTSSAFNWKFPNGEKNEKLIERIISMITNEGDIVLDSFLGSGTTAAVAHKMKRRWIGIEKGDHCYTHCINRLIDVIDGEQSGISRDFNWQGGGGFKFYELAGPLLIKNPILPIYQINPVYTFDMMAEAICKLEGFKYSPVGEYHGISSENRFIHVTNQFVNSSYVISITKNLDKHQSLLIYCTKKQSKMILPDNIEIKKIPKDLLEKCSFESEGM